MKGLKLSGMMVSIPALEPIKVVMILYVYISYNESITVSLYS